MRTYVAKGEEAEALKVGANWFVIDATNQVLGRLATKVARVLIGKDKPSFTPYLDSGDHVVVINAQKIRLTGNKLEDKMYREIKRLASAQGLRIGAVYSALLERGLWFSHQHAELPTPAFKRPPARKSK